MELVLVFTEETHEGLYTVCYEEGRLDELKRLFDAWNDIEYVTNYCNDNLEFLKTDFYTGLGISLGDAINRILKEAEYLSDDLYDFTNNSFEKGSPYCKRSLSR